MFKYLQLTLLLILPVAFSNCSSNNSNTKILSQIDSSIIQSNNAIGISNNNILESLKMRAADPKTKSKAEKMLPIAQHADSVVVNLLQYINGLKTAMKESLKSGGIKDFFEEQDRGSMLFKKLLAFKKDVAVDSVSEKEDWPTFIASSNDSLENFRAFVQHLQSASPIEAQTFLSSLQSDILQSEQQYLLYCLNATTTGCNLPFEVFEAIVGQNAKILKAGDELEITAGLGSFSWYKRPEISIAGKVIPLNEKGLVVHKIKTPKRSGNYSVPVKIQFLDQDGKPQERVFTVEYELVDIVIQR